MPINPSIALGVQPIQLNDPLQAYSNALRVQGARAEFDAARQARADQNSLREAYRGAYGSQGLNQNALLQDVAARGLGDQIPGLIDTFSKQKTAELNRLETVAKLQKGAATFVMANPQFARQALMRFGAQTGEDVTQQLAELDSLGGDAEAIRRWAAGHAASADQLLPKTETRDFGGYIGTTVIDPLTGRPGAPTKVADKTFAPGEQQRLATDTRRADLEAARLEQEKRRFALEMRKFEREGAEGAGGATEVTYQIDGNGNLVALPKKIGAAGATATPVTFAGGAPVKGKLSAGEEKARREKVQMKNDLDLTIKELEEASKDGGLIDQSTGSGAGALYDKGAAFFGSSTPGAIAAGRMAPIYDRALKMVPRFEGPQSDKDTASYERAAGELANPAVPNVKKKAAAREILRLMKERRGQFGSRDFPDAGSAAPDIEDSGVPTKTPTGASVSNW